MVDSIVMCKTTSRGTDILLTDNDENDILSTKAYLNNNLWHVICKADNMLY